MLHIYDPQLREILLNDGRIVKIPSNIAFGEGFSHPILRLITLWAVASGIISKDDEIGCLH